MGTVTVAIRKAGKIVELVERPLRDAAGCPAIVYRKQLWRLADGEVDLDAGPLNLPPADAGFGRHVAAQSDSPSIASVPPGASFSTDLPVLPPLTDLQTVPDDQAERDAIVAADACTRMLVEAGPGTGKTQMAALRLSALIQTELSPGQMLVLSFSRSAVRTLTRRLTMIAHTNEQLVEELRHVSIRTFDSWAFRILRLLGEEPAVLLSRGHEANIAALTAAIGGEHRENVRRLIGDRRHLIVDEFQDLPGVRGELVLHLLDLLAPPSQPNGCGFTILGDPVQAIYGFAAGSQENGPFPTPLEYWTKVRSLYGDELKVRTLLRNHRSDAPLAALSAELRSVLLGNLPDDEKLLHVRARIAALPVPVDDFAPTWLNDEAKSKAVLTRTNGEALAVLRRLVGNDNSGPTKPVRLRAGSYVAPPPAWIGALLRQVRAQNITRSTFGRIYAVLSGIWDVKTKQQLAVPVEETAWSRLALASGAPSDAMSIELSALRARLNWPDAFPDDQPLAEEGLIITTIHQSKGMEFDIVTLLESRRDHADEEDDDSAEASVAYVAVTRASQELNQIPASSIYTAPTNRAFPNNRARLCYWRYGWVNLEMGIRGDVDPVSFVDPGLLGGAEGVALVQEHLLINAHSLEGRKVMLCRAFVENEARYNIHIQEDSQPGMLIGRTSQQLTRDLLNLLWDSGYQLPSRILNLRIAAVGTFTAEGEIAIEDPDRSSRLWLGVGLFGTGDFKPGKRRTTNGAT